MEQTASAQDASAQFKLAMRAFAGAVTLITSSHAGHRYGMTATAVCSVSADPPTLLVCINRATTTHGAIARSGAFCVNVLRDSDRELSAIFSGAQKGEGRFRYGEWLRLTSGAPVLASALVSFDCRVAARHDHGTHSVFFGEVHDLRMGAKGKPLLYANGQYAKLAALHHGEPLPEGLDYWGF
jgi:flavin reductase (DIM6/NTAB) family NADH-FMN oxidoreductase RutF